MYKGGRGAPEAVRRRCGVSKAHGRIYSLPGSYKDLISKQSVRSYGSATAAAADSMRAAAPPPSASDDLRTGSIDASWKKLSSTLLPAFNADIAVIVPISAAALARRLAELRAAHSRQYLRYAAVTVMWLFQKEQISRSLKWNQGLAAGKKVRKPYCTPCAHYPS